MNIKIDTRDLKKFRKKAKKLNYYLRDGLDTGLQQLAESIITEVKLKTPVGTYKEYKDWNSDKIINKGHHGGTLRDSWTRTGLTRFNNKSVVTVFNPIYYAEYVEYGHRQNVGQYVQVLGKRLVQPYVSGKYMLRSTINEIRPKAQKIIINYVRGNLWK